MEWLVHMFCRQSAKERGTSVLEMALLTPVLLLLLLGIIDMGRYAELSIVVANAAHAGAQYGAQNLATAVDNTGIQNAAVSDAQNVLTPSQVSSSVLCGCTGGAGLGPSCPANCGVSGHQLVYVEVTTTGTFNALFRYPGIPSSITVSRMAQMRVAE
jgi:Flp pilus assembly protein TadG